LSRPGTIGDMKSYALFPTQPPSPTNRSAGLTRPPVWQQAVLFFGVWFTATSVAGVWMLALNASPSGEMPGPMVLRDARTAWYVLGADCGLSRAVAEQLAQHAPRDNLREQVCLLADDPEAARRLIGAGFSVKRTEPVALPGLRPGPWLFLFDSAGRRIFSGPFPKAWDRAEPGLGLPHFLAMFTPGIRRGPRLTP
jgi:hypothetical protein